MRDNYGVQIPFNICKISRGSEGTRETLSFMRNLSLQSARDPRIRSLGVSLVRHTDPRIDRERAARVLDWTQQHIQYVRDIRKIETLQAPQRTLIWRAGDCDDFSTLIAAILLSIGFQHLAFVAQKRFNFGGYKHVFVVVWIEGYWYKMDGTSKKTISIMEFNLSRHMSMRV